MKRVNVLVLGCGEMAQSLVLSLHQAQSLTSSSLSSSASSAAFPLSLQFFTYTPSQTRAKLLAEQVAGEVLSTLSDREFEEKGPFDLYLIACKPQHFPQLASTLQGRITSGLVVSLMAGVSLLSLRQSLQLPLSVGVVRTMPNTPVKLSKGATLITYGDPTTEDQQRLVKEMFQAVGEVFVTKNEEDLNHFTLIVGCGPAFIFEWARIWQDQLQQWGQSSEEAKKMVAQTFLGAAHLMSSSPMSFKELREQVTSKGGVTEAALKIMKQENIEQIMFDAFEAGVLRTSELS